MLRFTSGLPTKRYRVFVSRRLAAAESARNHIQSRCASLSETANQILSSYNLRSKSKVLWTFERDTRDSGLLNSN